MQRLSLSPVLSLAITVLSLSLDIFIVQTGAQNLRLTITGSRLPTPLGAHVAVADDDAIYILGGYNGTGFNRQIIRYSLDSGLVEQIGQFGAVSSGSAALSREGMTVFGGFGETESGNFEFIDRIERISTVDGSSTQVNSLPEPMYVMGPVRTTGNVTYLFGGKRNDIIALDYILKYDPATNRLDEVGRLPEHAASASAVWDSRRDLVYLFGGKRGFLFPQPAADILQYNLADASVTQLPIGLPYPVDEGCAVFAENVDELAYIVGEHSLITFNPASHRVQQLQVDNWPKSLTLAACVYVPRLARIYIIGGFGSFDGEEERHRDEIVYVDLGRK